MKKNPYHDESMWKGASPDTFRRAEYLRNNPTEAESKLWEKLQSKPFKKYHFRRQHPIHHFIADFYSHKLQLIIEVDGGYHENEEQKENDQLRAELLQFQKIEIIRFTNEQVLQDIENVVQTLLKKIDPSPFSGSPAYRQAGFRAGANRKKRPRFYEGKSILPKGRLLQSPQNRGSFAKTYQETK